MRKKVLVCILACAMLLFGMGYAYWTDSLQIETTASTGELNVKFIDLSLYGQYAGQDHEDGWTIIDGVCEDGYVGDFIFGRGTNYNIIGDPDEITGYYDRISGYTSTAFTAELKDHVNLGKQIGPYGSDTWASDTIRVNLTDIYPGYAQVFQSDIANVGTLAAKLSDIKVLVDQANDDVINDMIGISFYVLREYSSTAGHPNCHVDVFKTIAGSDPEDFFTVGGVDFIRLSALEGVDLSDLIDKTKDLLYILPDENRMDIYFGVAMDPDAEGVYTTGTAANRNLDNNDSDSELKAAGFTVQLLWDQFNVGHPAGVGDDTNNLES